MKNKMKTLINTLNLIGLTEISTDIYPERDWNDWVGDQYILSSSSAKDNEDNISLNITKRYCNFTGNKVGVYTILFSDFKGSKEEALDSLLEKLVGALESGKPVGEGITTNPDSYNLKTLAIPAGEFNFKGKTKKIDEFEMCETCVTWDDWEKYIKANPDKDIPNDDAGFGRGNRPVINVSWLDIQDYIKWLNEVTGEEYDLPTEAEWEYACRAGTSTDYYTGESININQANFYTEEVSVGKTTPVGSYPPNNYGLYDLHGNCWEFTSTIYGEDDD